MSVVLSSFFWTYSLGQVPAGWLSDRFGPRLMLGIYLAVWSLFTGLLGLAHGMVALVALRLGCGLFEAGAYPTAAGIVRNWMPFERRGLASGIVSIGGRFGGGGGALGDGAAHGSFRAGQFIVAVYRRRMCSTRRICSRTCKGAATSHSSDAQGALVNIILERLPAQQQESLRAGTMPKGTDFFPPLVRALNECVADPNLLNGLDLANLNLPSAARRLLEPSGMGRSGPEIEAAIAWFWRPRFPTLYAKSTVRRGGR